jgi:hypothetical protein
MMAKTNWILAESHRDRKKKPGNFELYEFLPMWLRPLSAKPANGDPDILYQKMQMFAIAMSS